MMKGVRKDLPPSSAAVENLDEEGEGASNSNSNESGFAPGSQHSSSNKTKVNSPPSQHQQQQFNFDKNPFKTQHSEKEEEFQTLYLPSGVTTGNGRPTKNGKINLPDISGISSCLESPVKEKLGVQHRRIDENVGKTLNSKFSSIQNQNHQRESSFETNMVNSDPIGSTSVSTTLSNRAKEFKDLIKILNGFKDQLEITGLRVDELEEFKTSWEDKLVEFGGEIEGWFEEKLKELGLNEKGKGVGNSSNREVVYPSETEQEDQEQEDVDGEGDETFTAANHDQDQTQDQEEVLMLRNNVLKLKGDLEKSLHVLKSLEERKEIEKERTQTRKNNHQPQTSRRTNAKRTVYASVSEDDDADDEGQDDTDSTRRKLVQIQFQMQTFERELRDLNRVVYDEIVIRESTRVGRTDQDRNVSKPSSRSKNQPQSQRKAHVSDAHSESELDLGEINPSEMDKIFIRPNSAASATKIAAALGSKKRFRHVEDPGLNPPSSPFRRSTGSVSMNSDASSNRDEDDERDEFVRNGGSHSGRRRKVASYDEVRSVHQDNDDDGDETRSNSHVGPGREQYIKQFKNARVFKNSGLAGYVQSSPTKPSKAKKPHSSRSNSRDQQQSRPSSSKISTRNQTQSHVEVSHPSLMTPPQSPILNNQELQSEQESEDDDQDREFFDDEDLTREITSRVERAEATTQKSQKERKAREKQHLNHLDGNHSKKSCSVCSKDLKSQKKRNARKERIKEFERNKRIEDEEEEGILNLLSLKEQENEERLQEGHQNGSNSHSSRLKLNLNSNQINLLKRIIDEHLDEFLHQRDLYSQLADDFKKIDPQMPAIKRRIFASHLLDSVESLEFKANRINQLQDLLEDSFDDDDDQQFEDEEIIGSEDEFGFLDQVSDGDERYSKKKSNGNSKPQLSEKALGKQRAKDDRRNVSAMRNSPPMNDISEPQINQRTGRMRSTVV